MAHEPERAAAGVGGVSCLYKVPIGLALIRLPPQKKAEGFSLSVQERAF